jgi:hypothetical protein
MQLVVLYMIFLYVEMQKTVLPDNTGKEDNDKHADRQQNDNKLFSGCFFSVQSYDVIAGKQQCG